MKTRDLASRRRVIDLLKKKCFKTEDLSEEAEVPIRTLWRILGELKTLGLVYKKGVYWTWCRYKKPWKGNVVMYDIAIKHAKDLLPGFLALIADPPQSRRFPVDNHISPELKEFAESHLKTAPSYQSTYINLIEYRRLESKFDELYTEEIEKMLQGLRGKILTPNRLKITSGNNFLNQELDGFFFGSQTRKRDIPYALGPFDTKEEISDVLGVYKIISTGLLFQTDKTKKWYLLRPIAVDVDSHKTLKKLDDFIQTKEEMINVYGDLTRQIHMLKLRIDHGQPLDEDSHCEICPNIIIKEEDTPQKNQCVAHEQLRMIKVDAGNSGEFYQ